MQFFFADGEHALDVFLTRKEHADKELSAKLRAEGIITTLGELFKRLREQEINGLIARGVFEFI